MLNLLFESNLRHSSDRLISGLSDEVCHVRAVTISTIFAVQVRQFTN